MTPKIVRVMLAGGTRGAGTDDDPVRTVAELFTLDGVPLGEYDPHTGESRMYPEGLQRLGFKHAVWREIAGSDAAPAPDTQRGGKAALESGQRRRTV